LNEYEVYCLYSALKQHFTSDYDFFKYNGKVRHSIKSFEKRKDKWFFIKIARKIQDPKAYLIANFLDDKKWIGEFSEDSYVNWLKRQQSMTYMYETDLGCLYDNFNENFALDENQHPHVLKLFLSGKIFLESLMILLDLTNSWRYYDVKLKDDILWVPISLKLQKYSPFFWQNYDKGKFRLLTQTRFGVTT
jgi:hypothetical protein